MKTILVVDDNSSVRTLLQEYLNEQGFKVVTAANGRDAIYCARHTPPDLILLDLMMPEMDGYTFLRQHRQEKNTPIIIITAKEEETDAVLGLELGADDYVIKPFRMRELVSRINAVLRRYENASTGGRILKCGEIVLDENIHTVPCGQRNPVTPSEFDRWYLMSRRRGYSRANKSRPPEQRNFSMDRTRTFIFATCEQKSKQPNNPSISKQFLVGPRFRIQHELTLTRKLILAFLLVAGTSAALVAVFIRLTNVERVTQLVLEQQRRDLEELIVTYYNAYGTLLGIDRYSMPQNYGLQNENGGSPAYYSARRISLHRDETASCFPHVPSFRQHACAVDRLARETVIVNDKLIAVIIPRHSSHLTTKNGHTSGTTGAPFATAGHPSGGHCRACRQPLTHPEPVEVVPSKAGGRWRGGKSASRDEIGERAQAFNQVPRPRPPNPLRAKDRRHRHDRRTPSRSSPATRIDAGCILGLRTPAHINLKLIGCRPGGRSNPRSRTEGGGKVHSHLQSLGQLY